LVSSLAYPNLLGTKGYVVVVVVVERCTVIRTEEKRRKLISFQHGHFKIN
jgi:hypothetical protein